MKKYLIILVLLAFCLPGSILAQSNVERRGIENSGSIVNDSIADKHLQLTDMGREQECSLLPNSSLQPYSRRAYMEPVGAPNDSLHLPALTMQGQVPLMSYPYDTWWGFDSWQLHRGLNMNLGASVFAAFGKGAPKGAGFGQDLSMMYAMPLNKHLSLAVGGWVSNAYWAHDRFTDAGLSAVLGYKFNDRWEAYVYGRKSLVNKPVPYRFYTMQELGDRIGAAVKYNFSPSCSLQISVSAGETKVPAMPVYDADRSWNH